MRKRLIRIGVPVIVLAALAGGGVAWATAGGDDVPLTGTTLERATDSALEHTGGGTVVETEVGDDGAAYGVEIRLDDGRVVEVSLDENFDVVGRENDDEDGPNDDED